MFLPAFQSRPIASIVPTAPSLLPGRLVHRRAGVTAVAAATVVTAPALRSSSTLRDAWSTLLASTYVYILACCWRVSGSHSCGTPTSHLMPRHSIRTTRVPLPLSRRITRCITSSLQPNATASWRHCDLTLYSCTLCGVPHCTWSLQIATDLAPATRVNGQLARHLAVRCGVEVRRSYGSRVVGQIEPPN